MSTLKQFVFAAAVTRWADVLFNPWQRVCEGKGGVELHFKHLSSSSAAAGSCLGLWFKVMSAHGLNVFKKGVLVHNYLFFPSSLDK